MDGSHHQIFLTSKTVLWPNGLSLDVPQGILYWVDAYYDRIEMVYLNTTERKVGKDSACNILGGFLFLNKSGRLSWVNRWCTKARSLTTPLAYATTNSSSFGTSTAAAASTSSTRPPKQSHFFATRGHRSLRSECTTLTSSKVRLPPTHQPSQLEENMSDSFLPGSPFRLGSNACRVNNGGCSSLCLAIPDGRSCGCADDQILDADNVTCKGT